MKILYGIAVLLGLLIAANQALLVEEKVHFLRERGKSSSFTLVNTIPATSNPKGKPDVCVSGALTSPRPTDGPPEKIQVGVNIYAVHYVEPSFLHYCGVWAFTDTEKHVIALDRSRGRQAIREDVLHELMHIALIDGGGRHARTYDNPDDDFIKPTAPQLRDILIDNPSLVKWLLTPVQAD